MALFRKKGKKGSEKGEEKEKGSNEKERKKDETEKKLPRLRTGINFRRDVLGKVWFRLDYYDRRLMKLDDDKQKTFLNNYMESTRQLNRSLVTIIIFMIITYIIHAFGILNMAETAAAWIILLYLLFYLASRHKKENEELLRYLLDTEITPEYAKFAGSARKSN